MCITENLAIVAFYDLQELFPSVPLVSMSGILMPKTVCLGAYSILVLFFFLKKKRILVNSTFIPPKSEEPKMCLHWKNIYVRFLRK